MGVYSVALTLTTIAWILPQALQTVLFPRVASLDEATAAWRDALPAALAGGVSPVV